VVRKGKKRCGQKDGKIENMPNRMKYGFFVFLAQFPFFVFPYENKCGNRISSFLVSQ